MSEPQITVNGRPRAARRRASPHQRSGLPARPRPDRRQGRLRGGGVRRLRGPGRPAGRRGPREPLDADQRLPGPGRRPRRPGGRHLGGAGHPGHLHPVQHEMAVRGGSQCGYCTPGFVCAMAAEYYRPERVPHDQPDAEHGPNGFDLHAMGGNLCRCTGYRPIRDAAWALGAPPQDDALAERQGRPAPAPPATRMADFARPADLAEALDLLRRAPRRHGRGRRHRLGRRGQPARPPGDVRRGGGPAAGAARGRTRRAHRDRCRPHLERGRGRRWAGPCRCWTRSGRSSRPG